MTKTYVYGLPLGPTVNADLVEEQMRLAHKYRNALIEIERERREKVREVYDERDLALEGLVEEDKVAKSELKRATEDLKRQRAKTRSRSDTAEQRERVKEVRKAAQEVAKRLSEARKELKLDEDLQERLSRANLTASEKSQAAQQGFSREGLFWGTYLQVDNAMEDSRRDLKMWDEHGQPLDPKFLQWRGDGTVAVQLQGDKHPVEKIFSGEDTFLQVDMEPPPEGVVSKTRRKKRRGVMKIRIGSTESRGPVWAEFPIIMHRPLPQGVRIKWAVVKRRMISERPRWTVHFSLGLPAEYQHEEFGSGRGAVAVDIGWRKRGEDQIRVAYLVDGDEYAAYLRDRQDPLGRGDELLMEPEVVRGFDKVESLQSIRALNQNEMQKSLKGWIKSNKKNLPEWFREDVRYLHSWKSPKRYAGLLRKWGEKRWDGDGEGFQILKDWLSGTYEESLGRRDGGDRHLWQWKESQEQKSLRRRKDHYRRVAAKLARKYKVLVIEDFKLTETQKHEPPESEKVEIQAARNQQKEAACYELRMMFVQAFLARGGTVVWVDARMTTQRCFECGCLEPWDAIPEVDHVCVECGAKWDQDANAARNIMRLYRNDETLKMIDGSVPVEPKMSRRQKGRKKGKKIVQQRKSQEAAQPSV